MESGGDLSQIKARASTRVMADAELSERTRVSDAPTCLSDAQTPGFGRPKHLPRREPYVGYVSQAQRLMVIVQHPATPKPVNTHTANIEAFIVSREHFLQSVKDHLMQVLLVLWLPKECVLLTRARVFASTEKPS